MARTRTRPPKMHRNSGSLAGPPYDQFAVASRGTSCERLRIRAGKPGPQAIALAAALSRLRAAGSRFHGLRVKNGKTSGWFVVKKS